MFWKKEASRSRREREERVAQLAGLEDEARKWRNEAVRLRAEVDRLKPELNGRDDDDEDEMLAMEEMQEILDRINASANADFEHLSDAVGFLLEGG
jgi:seryl-tRNA synthetase